MRALSLLLLSLASLGCGDAPSQAPPAQTTPLSPIVEPADRAAAPSAAGEGRDLEADERAGGHTISRHVGKTDEQLRDRLARQRGISAASTWTDRGTAARTVKATLGQARTRLERWSRRSGGRPNLALDWRGREVVGRSLERGARRPVDVTCAVVVLRWDTRRDDFYVLTSYPEVCR
jgi:hypothetical protein